LERGQAFWHEKISQKEDHSFGEKEISKTFTRAGGTKTVTTKFPGEKGTADGPPMLQGKINLESLGRFLVRCRVIWSPQLTQSKKKKTPPRGGKRVPSTNERKRLVGGNREGQSSAGVGFWGGGGGGGGGGCGCWGLGLCCLGGVLVGGGGVWGWGEEQPLEDWRVEEEKHKRQLFTLERGRVGLLSGGTMGRQLS